MGAKDGRPGLSISDALFGTVRRSVLGLLYGHADERFYQRQIVRELAVGYGAVQRELRRLTECGVLRRVAEGRQTYYQANSECPVFEELRGLIRKTSGVADMIRAALVGLSAPVRVAFIFGSIAEGREHSASDVDVLVVGDAVRPADVYAAIHRAQQVLHREVNPKVYPTREFCRKLSAGQHFLRSVVAGPKIFLIGDERELANLATERLAHGSPGEPFGDR